IGGLDSAAEATLKLPEVPAGKKLIYTNINMEMTAINEFEAKGKADPRFARLAEMTNANHGLWCAAAEKYLLENW
ncbi:MAG TPA: L-sorbose 1-phosphate reductase, partial [Firmicutes bacterium]|nr:L-sorbose 1-phosphate reductase [Bacillota bacterium]